MLNLCTGIVAEVLESRKGIQKIKVTTDENSEVFRQAICYPELSGAVGKGDHVLLNTTAMALNLGTGGWDFVVANLSRLEKGPSYSVGEPTSGHLMKLRYTPLQAAFAAAEEDADLPTTLRGIPVIVAELHSQLAPILLGLQVSREHSGKGYPKVAYVMPDTGTIPLAFSETVPQLKERGLLHATITCGHAFGGDFEAVTLGSALAVAAGSAEADVIVVIQGPGNSGTGSPLGFGALYQAEALHLVHALEGIPLFVPRISYADPRARHDRLSHHSRTLLERLILCPVSLCLPEPSEEYPDPLSGVLLRVDHRTCFAPLSSLQEALSDTDLSLRSMGRSYAEDPFFFLAAAAGGWIAGNSLPKL